MIGYMQSGNERIGACGWMMTGETTVVADQQTSRAKQLTNRENTLKHVDWVRVCSISDDDDGDDA